MDIVTPAGEAEDNREIQQVLAAAEEDDSDEELQQEEEETHGLEELGFEGPLTPLQVGPAVHSMAARLAAAVSAASAAASTAVRGGSQRAQLGSWRTRRRSTRKRLRQSCSRRRTRRSGQSQRAAAPSIKARARFDSFQYPPMQRTLGFCQSCSDLDPSCAAHLIPPQIMFDREAGI